MDLERVIIKNVPGKAIGFFLKYIEELPSETISGDFSGVIYACLNSITQGVSLDFEFDSKDQFDKVEFKLPENSIMIKVKNYGVNFVYNSTHYHLIKKMVSR